MTDLHPHWQATADETQHFPRVPSVPARIAVKGASVSRIPAAIVGVVLSFAIGFTAIQGWDMLRGQLNQPPPPDVHEAASMSQQFFVVIDDTGITSGKEVSVIQGDQIVFQNTGTIPQILTTQSTALINGSGVVFDLTIFPGEEASFVVGTAPQGTYQYLSSTNNAVNGTIVVEPLCTPGSAVSVDGPFGTLDGVPLPTGHGTGIRCKTPPSGSGNQNGFGTGGSQATGGSIGTVSGGTSGGNSLSGNSTAGQTAGTTAGSISGGATAGSLGGTIAGSTGTVSDNGGIGGVGNGSLGGNGFNTGVGNNTDLGPTQPIPTNQNTVTGTSTAAKPCCPQKNTNPCCKKAPAQPESGPEVWVACMLSFACLVWVTRKSLLRTR